jgi:hypothetical protein
MTITVAVAVTVAVAAGGFFARGMPADVSKKLTAAQQSTAGAEKQQQRQQAKRQAASRLASSKPHLLHSTSGPHLLCMAGQQSAEQGSAERQNAEQQKRRAAEVQSNSTQSSKSADRSEEQSSNVPGNKATKRYRMPTSLLPATRRRGQPVAVNNDASQSPRRDESGPETGDQRRPGSWMQTQ